MYLIYDGRSLPRDGTARVSVTSITTDDSLSCLYSSPTARAGANTELKWHLNGVEIQRSTGSSQQSYLGWSSAVIVKAMNVITMLKRDSDTVATEGVFTCRYGDLSISVGVFYPSK